MKQSRTLPRGASRQNCTPRTYREGPVTGLKHKLLSEGNTPSPGICLWELRWCASSRGRRRMRTARLGQVAQGPRGPASPSHTPEGRVHPALGHACIPRSAAPSNTPEKKCFTTRFSSLGSQLQVAVTSSRHRVLSIQKQGQM